MALICDGSLGPLDSDDFKCPVPNITIEEQIANFHKFHDLGHITDEERDTLIEHLENGWSCVVLVSHSFKGPGDPIEEVSISISRHRVT